MKTKITLLGAGSGFTQPLFTDILNIEGLDEGVIGLVDIDKPRLDVNVKIMRRVIELLGRKGWTVEASTDRRKILPGTDYLINTIEVSGTACVQFDNDIPLKYGIDQTIGDTMGPGGVMKALRTLPVFLAILEDAKRLCPEALILNYTNPMSAITLAGLRTTTQPLVGLCHSVQGTTRWLANHAGVPYEEIVWRCGGINHMAWIVEFKHKGRDLYPQIKANISDPARYDRSPIPFETILQLGLASTEGSGHFSEYVPYFRKRKDLVKLYTRPGYDGESGFYAREWPGWRKRNDQERREMAEGKREVPLKRSFEYASDIVEAHRFDRQKTIYASVQNTGLIPNLPQTGVVEVATLVDKRGFSPTYFGNLPEQCAALCRSNMALFELVVQGVMETNREKVIHAMMMDPLSAAVCSMAEIRAMAEELFKAEKAFIPAWVNKVAKASAVRRTGGANAHAGMEEVSSMAARGAQTVAERKRRGKA